MKFDHLDFDCSPNERNVNRLETIFRQSGCCHLRQENQLLGFIDAKELETALEALGLSRESLLSNNSLGRVLDLPSHTRITCIDGRSRVFAAKRVLKRQDWSWAVSLYTQGYRPLSLLKYSNKRARMPHATNSSSPGEGCRGSRNLSLLAVS